MSIQIGSFSRFLIGAAMFACVGCSEVHTFDSPDEDACDHFATGPFESLNSKEDGRVSIPHSHIVYRTTLPLYNDPDHSFGDYSFNVQTHSISVYTQGANASFTGKRTRYEDIACGIRVGTFETEFGNQDLYLGTEGDPEISVLVIPHY